MRRRWVLALLLATAILFSLAGTTLGYYVIPDSKGKSADCIILSHDLEGLTYSPGSNNQRANDVVAKYNAECR